MTLSLLLVLLTASALTLHVARYWRPLGFAASVAATILLVWAVQNTSATTFDLFGMSFGLQPLARDYLLAAMALSGMLAIATSFGDVRRTLGFLFWSWIVWLVALAVNDFVIGVFAWASGLAVIVIAMEPRHGQRTGGAAYYLVLIIVAAALLLIGHRFVQLYPLTPDQVALVDSAILFLAWGLGLLLAIVPFIVWLGPMADETPLPVIAVLVGLGQPIGLWLLYGLIGQYPRLLEQSNLLAIMTLGGIGSVIVGGALCALERRAGRLMSYAALFALGFILLDLSRGTLEGTAFAVIETFARAVSLGLMAASISIVYAVRNRWVSALALLVFVLGALNLAGLTPGISLVTRWNILLELEATDRRIFFLVMLATVGVLIGMARYVLLWFEAFTPTEPAENGLAPSPPPTTLVGRIRFRVRAQLVSWSEKLARRVPPPVERARRGAAENWRAFFAALLLLALGAFVLWYNVTPNIWLQRALETVGQLEFMR
ncbi:MAG: hypothetical protein HY741_26445 [Chloroflexi bacterium]|nr:hypothetical protein [Chloroflexota bacterium]